jgi:putative endonuclease
MSEWYVYILRCADNSLYTGVATDLVARVSTHNAGKGAKYTRGRRPVVLVYQEVVVDRAAAQRREAEIKRMPAESKREFVRLHNGVDNLSFKNGSDNLG